MVHEKRCPSCGKTKPREAFAVDRHKANGLQSRCRECFSAYHRSPEGLAVGLRYRQSRKGRENRSRQEKSASYLEGRRRWRSENAWRWKHYNSLRKAREAALPATLTKEQWAQTVADFQGRCAYCCSTEGVGMDHFDPIGKGGSHTAANVLPSCRACNRRKHAKLPMIFCGLSLYTRLRTYLDTRL